MKSRSRFLRWGLRGWLLLGMLVGAVNAAGPEIALSDTNVRPGDFLRIKVRAERQAMVRVIFQGAAKTLPESGAGTFIGLLAVSYETDPGIYPLGVEIVKGRDTTTALYQLRVMERKFPESRVTMDAAKQKSLLTPANQGADFQKTREIRTKVLAAAGLPLWRGPFLWPLKGTITTEFGYTRYINDVSEGRHSGLDIAAPGGTPVMAAAGGRVIFAGNLYLTGLTVIIYHGLDLFSSYGHLSALKIRDGDRVTQGDPVGLIGSTGLSTGPHVHFTFRIGEIAVDPNLFLDREVDWEF